VRKTSNSNSPLQNVNSTEMRCNSGGLSGIALNTQTYSVSAGDMLGFAIKDTFGHTGPQQVYISKAPGKAAEYDGSGDWTKIYSLTYPLNSSEGAGDGLLKGLRTARTHSTSNYLQTSQLANIYCALKALRCTPRRSMPRVTAPAFWDFRLSSREAICGTRRVC
jgi:hypothetical protein